MSKWTKWIIIALAVIVGTIFFGSMVLSLFSYLLDFMSTATSWFAEVARWLAKLVDVFGFTGIFTAHASEEIAIIAQDSKIAIELFKGGC